MQTFLKPFKKLAGRVLLGLKQGAYIYYISALSPGLDAPRVAGSFPNSPSEVSSENFLPPSVRPIPDSPNLQVCLVFITCHFGKILKSTEEFYSHFTF